MSRGLRLILWFAVGLCLGGFVSYASAAQYALQMPSNIGGSAGARVVTGAIDAVNDRMFSSAMTTSVGGRAVTVPASWRFAANAGRLAADAVRLNPTWMAVAGVAAWLAPYGLEWIENQWMRAGSSSPADQSYAGTITKWIADGYTGCNSQNFQTPLACAQYVLSTTNSPSSVEHQQYYIRYTIYKFGNPYNVNVRPVCASGSGGIREGVTGCYLAEPVTNCPAGTTLNNGFCVGAATPAGTSDWDAVAAGTVPDVVLRNTAALGTRYSVDEPIVSPTPQRIPLSDPYPMPDGSTARDVAQVTPQPSNPGWVDVQYLREPVTDSVGNPVAQPEATRTSEERSDLCRDHPDILACQEMGEAEEVDLEVDERQIAIQPQSGWGLANASCPADLTETLHTGLVVRFSWSPVCQAATALRPLVIGMAWLSAVLVAVAISRRAQG